VKRRLSTTAWTNLTEDGGSEWIIEYINEPLADALGGRRPSAPGCASEGRPYSLKGQDRETSRW
jgi:hypothetical protein